LLFFVTGVNAAFPVSAVPKIPLAASSRFTGPGRIFARLPVGAFAACPVGPGSTTPGLVFTWARRGVFTGFALDLTGIFPPLVMTGLPVLPGVFGCVFFTSFATAGSSQ
jgi:hypothetical protein